MFRTLLLKETEPTIRPLPHQTDCPTPKSCVRCRLTLKESGDRLLTYDQIGKLLNPRFIAHLQSPARRRDYRDVDLIDP